MGSLPRRARRPSLLTLLALLTLPGHSQAQRHCPASNDRPEEALPLRQLNGSFAAQINAGTGSSKRSVRRLLNLFERVDGMMKKGDPTTGGAWDCLIFFPANLTRTQVRLYGWGEMSHCTYRLLSKYLPRQSLRAPAVFRAIHSFVATVQTLAPAALPGYGLDWPGAESTQLYTHKHADRYRKCTLAKGLAYRLDGRWGLAAVFTNDSVQVDVDARLVFKEVIGLDDRGDARPFEVNVPVCKGVRNKTRPPRVRKATATVAVKSGFIEPTHASSFGGTALTSSTAMLEALELGEYDKEMIEQSDTVSSMAVLTLPVFLALVPIAVLQDANLLATVLYAIATDVVSVLPMALKGLEMIVYASREHYAFFARMFGFKTDNDVSAVEIQAARCNIHPTVRRQGIGLLFAALIVMAAGIVLEFGVRHIRVRRKKRVRWLGKFGLERGPLFEISQLPAGMPAPMGQGVKGAGSSWEEMYDTVVDVSISRP